MKKKVWIMNHYAHHMLPDKAGRHYWFSEFLYKKGFEPVVFCANNHNTRTNEQMFPSSDLWIEKKAEEINTPFVYVRARGYKDNGKQRVLNMLDFYRNLKRCAMEYAKKNGKPDVIIASSVHPLTMVAGIQIARKLKIRCICEIRDLWPEAIFQFGKTNEKSIIGRLLIKGEHWIYKRADALIFTKEGDTDYLKERRWTTAQGGDIDLEKCHYINNGVDIKACDDRCHTVQFDDPDLNDETRFNVTYIGTIRPVNNVGNLLDAAKIIKDSGFEDIRFLIYGDGIQLPELKKRVDLEHIDNVIIKGYVNRQYVPFILSKSSINMLNYAQKQYNWTRGNSSNKLFEYMASGKPIISTVHMGYSIIQRYNCGIELDEDTPEALAKQIIRFHDMSKDEIEQIGRNARQGANDFDFSVLTDRLIEVIESVI